MIKNKKRLELLLSILLLLGSVGCNTQDVNTDLATEIVTNKLTSIIENSNSETEQIHNIESLETKSDDIKLKNQIWKDYLNENIHYTKKALVIDFNKDGEMDLIYIDQLTTTLAYYYNDTIKELSSNQYWGDGCNSGGMPFYYNKLTNKIMTMNYHSGYYIYNFYDYTYNDYQLTHEFIQKELKVAFTEDRLAELPYPPDDMSMEELIENALGLGYYDRVNQYTIDDIEVSEEEWQSTIDNFINDSACVTLCPCNTDLSFVNSEDVEGDFTNYIEENLFK